MAVFRLERTGNFTVMANLHLRDKSLSLKAKGLLSQMLSLPEDWDYTPGGAGQYQCRGEGRHSFGGGRAGAGRVCDALAGAG